MTELNRFLNVHPHGGMLTLQRELGNHQGHTSSAIAQIWAKELSVHDFIDRPATPVPGFRRYISNFIRDPGIGAIAWAEAWCAGQLRSQCHP